MAALLTNEKFADQTDATVLTSGTATNWTTVTGTATLTQHYNNLIFPGVSCLACFAETGTKYAVHQDTAGAIRGVSFIGIMTALPAVNCYIAELRASSTAVGAQLRIDTGGGIQMRNLNTAVGSAIQLVLGQLHRIDWLVNNTSSTQTLTVYDFSKINSTDTTRAIGTTSGAYNQGTIDYTRIGNIASVAGGMNYMWSYVSIDDAALPTPSFSFVNPMPHSRSAITL